MKTLEQLANEIQEAQTANVPHTLADLHIECAVKYARLTELYKPIAQEKAQFWAVYKFPPDEKPKSDTYVDIQWNAYPAGQKETRLKLELKALEKLMSAIKSALVNATVEAKNQA